jgi:hypothetical protein
MSRLEIQGNTSSTVLIGYPPPGLADPTALLSQGKGDATRKGFGRMGA